MAVARCRVDSASPPDPELVSGAATVTIRTDRLPKTSVPPGPQQARCECASMSSGGGAELPEPSGRRSMCAM